MLAKRKHSVFTVSSVVDLSISMVCASITINILPRTGLAGEFIYAVVVMEGQGSPTDVGGMSYVS